MGTSIHVSTQKVRLIDKKKEKKKICTSISHTVGAFPLELLLFSSLAARIDMPTFGAIPAYRYGCPVVVNMVLFLQKVLSCIDLSPSGAPGTQGKKKTGGKEGKAGTGK